MPMRKLPNGKYLIKPPSRNLIQIISRPSGTVCYTGIPLVNPVTLTTPVPQGEQAYLKIIP